MKKSVIIICIVILIALTYGVFFYCAGIITSIDLIDIAIAKHFNNVLLGKSRILDLVSNKSELLSLVKTPLKAIKQAFLIDKRILIVISIIIAFVVLYRLFLFIIFHEQIFNYLGFNRLIRDKKGTFGTAKFADEKDIRKLIKEETLESEKGIILGITKKPRTVEFMRKYNIAYRITLSPNVQMLNGHAIVVSGSGAGKTFNFVFTNAINAIRDGVNVLFTDPKGELFTTLSRYYEKNDYVVRVLNLINIYKSDRFNPLDLVEDDLDAKIYIDVLFENARSLESTGVNDFWDGGAKDLLKAIILYIKTIYPKEKQNMGEAYDLIIEAVNIDKMDILFNDIADDTACKRSYRLFRNSDERARQGIIQGLGLKLEIFQHADIRYLTSATDVNMYDLKTKKSAFFLIIPDTHRTYNFIPSIFMNFLFIKLPHLHDNTTDEKIKNTRLRIFADEIANVGKIANLENVITTLRSRKIDFFPIYQNIAQIKKAFGDGWETITGNCDTFITLGVNDEETSEYISKKLGKQTIKVINKNKTDGLANLTNIKRWSISEQERDLMQASEIRKLSRYKCITFIKGENPILLYKYPFSAMKEYKEVKSLEINIKDYIPIHQRPQVEQKEENSIGEQQFILSKPVIVDEVGNITEEINECQMQKKQKDEDIINDISDIMDDDDIL